MTLEEIREQFPQYNDLSDQDLANAFHRKFYADMPRAEFNQRIGFREGVEQSINAGLPAQTAGPPIPQPVGAPEGPSMATNIGRSVAEGATLGFFPEIVAGGQTALGAMGAGPERSFAENVQRQEAIQSEIPPELRIPGNIAGGIGTGVGVAGALPRAAIATVPRAAALGAAEGAVAGAGFAPPGERAQGAGVGAVTGGVLGAAAPVIGRGVQRLRQGRPSMAPQIAELRKEATQNYDLADASGLVVKPESFQRSVVDLAAKMKKLGIDPIIHPMSAQALKRIIDQADTGQPLPLREFQTLREIASNAKGAARDKDIMRAAEIVDHLDDYLGSLGQQNILAGDPVQADKALRTARNLWSRTRKAEEIEVLLERAADSASQFSQSGMENAIRREFKTFVKNKKNIRRFTKPEQAALRRVAQGGPITNTLRNIGRFAPKGPVSFGTGVGGTLLAEGAIGLPPGALVLPATAATGAATIGARIGTQRAARKASEIIRRGAPAPRNQGSPLARALVLGGVPGAAGQFGPR